MHGAAEHLIFHLLLLREWMQRLRLRGLLSLCLLLLQIRILERLDLLLEFLELLLQRLRFFLM